MRSRDVNVQICLDGVESAIQAQLGGADSIELCSNLPEGGTTPDAGNIALIRQMVSVELNVLIRPRSGDFLYTDLEFEIIKRNIDVAKTLGADGVVIGMLLPDGRVDSVRTRVLMDLAHPLQVTFHRAFDMVRDPFQTLDELIDLGIHRVLTSGQQPTAEKGMTRLAELIKYSAGEIEILPGGGINQRNARNIIEGTGAIWIHAGSSTSEVIESGMVYRNKSVGLGPGGRNAGAPLRRQTRGSLVAALIEAAKR